MEDSLENSREYDEQSQGSNGGNGIVDFHNLDKSHKLTDGMDTPDLSSNDK